jgi:hypothetical protein
MDAVTIDGKIFLAIEAFNRRHSGKPFDIVQEDGKTIIRLTNNHNVNTEV